MTKIFEIIDKTRRTIHLTGKRWAHIQKHPGLVDQIERIIGTLQHPDATTKVSSDPNVRNYYRHYKDKKEYLLVSVKYLNGKGFVITSFYTDKIK